jgi:tRNA A37 threonylcarbamoyladenosine dehydratase
MNERFIRTQALMGIKTLQNYNKASVLVAGLGGVGGWASEILVRSGIGHLILMDKDVIEISNFNRQVFASEETLNLSKYQAASSRLLSINPNLTISGGQFFINNNNINELLTRYRPHFIIDAIDSIAPKCSLIVAALQHNIPIISCLGAARKTDPTLFKVVNLFETYNCPLARALRLKLRKSGVQQKVLAIFSPENPKKEELDGLVLKPGQKFLGSYAPTVMAAGLLAAHSTLEYFAKN